MNPFVYISYAWGDIPESEEAIIVNGLYKALTENGFNVVIDKNSLDYHQSLPKFFKSIGMGGIVIPIVGKKYLTRTNCLIEAANMIVRGDIKERIFPLVLSNNYDIYDTTKRSFIINDLKAYWKNKELELRNAIKFNDELAHSYIPIREDLNLVSQIIATISIFVDHVGNYKQFNMDDELKNNFTDFINHVVLKTKENVERTFYEKPPGEYFGRNDDIKLVDDFLKDETKHFLLLYGVGGMGKTHLLGVCLEKFNYAKKFFWIKGDENFDLRKLFEKCNLRYPTESKRIKETCSLFFDEFSSKNLFLIIDDYYEITNPEIREMLPQLASMPSGKLLIVSREVPHNIEKLSVYKHEVPALEKDDFLKAMNAFILYMGSRKFTDEELEKIFDKAMGYPLGGRLIISLADANSDIALDDILKDIVKFDAELDPDGKEFSDRLLDNIFKKGNSAEIKILTEFSALFGFPTMEIIRQLPSFKMSEFLTLVRRRRFISNNGTGIFSTHAMIRDFAYDKLEDKENTHAKLGSYFETKLQESKEVDWGLIEAAIQHFSHANQKELTEFGHRIQVRFGLSDVMVLIEENAKNTIRNLKSMLTIDPDNIYYIHRLGMVYRSIGNIDLAITTFEKLISIDHGKAIVLNELGISYRQRKRDGDIDLAIATFNKAIEIEPSNIPSYNELTISYLERGKVGDIDLAINTFKKLIAFEPDNVILLFKLGNCYRKRKKEGDIDLAITTFEKVIYIDPINLRALNELAICYSIREKDDDINLAIVHFKKAMAIDPDEARLLIKLGDCYRRRKKAGDIDLAIDALKKAMAIEPDNIRMLYNLGICYRERNNKGDIDLAIDALKKAMAIEPNNIRLVIKLSYCYQERKKAGDIDLAIATLKKAIAIDPNNLKLVIRLSYWFQERNKKGDIDLAITSLKNLITIIANEPDNVKVLIELGYSYIMSHKRSQKQEDLDLAIITFNNVIDIDPENSKALALLGKAYFFKKDFKNSIRFCEKAIRADPSNTQSYAILHTTYLFFDKFWEATDAIKRGLKNKPKDKLLLKIKEDLIKTCKWEE